MTEYDYSPEAEMRYHKKMASVDQWRCNTSQFLHSSALADPFEPATPHKNANKELAGEIGRPQTTPPEAYHPGVPQWTIQYSPPHKHHNHSHRRHLSHSQQKPPKSYSSGSYASASTANLAARPPMPTRSHTAFIPPQTMMMPQPVRANTFPNNNYNHATAGPAGYPNPNPAYQTQGQAWPTMPQNHNHTPFIPPMPYPGGPNPFLGASKRPEPLIKRVFTGLFRGGKGSPAASIVDESKRSQSSLGHHSGGGHKSRKRRDSY